MRYFHLSRLMCWTSRNRFFLGNPECGGSPALSHLCMCIRATEVHMRRYHRPSSYNPLGYRSYSAFARFERRKLEFKPSTSHPPGEASSCPAHCLTPDRVLSLCPFSSSRPHSVPPFPLRPREQEARQSDKMSDQEDLDYYIMYPSFPPSPKDPTLAATGQDQREEFVFVYEEDKRPVVILLGWAGCQDRYLAKYSSIYEEKRYFLDR